MLDYNLFYDDVPKEENDLFRTKEFLKIMENFEGQKIIIMCPNCHKKQEADLAYYIIGRRWIGHPYTCTCGDHVEMIKLKEE